MKTVNLIIQDFIRAERDLTDLIEEAEERAAAHEGALWLTIVLIVAILL
jgi:hypothetical protein